MTRCNSSVFFISLMIFIEIVSFHGAHQHKVSSQGADYFLLRESLLAKDYKLSIAGTVKLEGLEVRANEQLMKYALIESNAGVQHPGSFPPFHDVPHYLEEIMEMPVFKILKAMPKGALLHTHAIGMGSAEYIYSVTYWKNLYACFVPVDRVSKLRFFNYPDDSCETGWKLLVDYRKDPFVDVFLKEALSMLKKVPFRDSRQIAETSKEVQELIYGLLSYKPVFEDYVYQTLLELYQDGIRYYELRAYLKDLYDADGNIYGSDDILQIFQEVLVNFQIHYPNFYGLKIIYCIDRNLADDEIIQHLHHYEDLKLRYGGLLAGIDLFGRTEGGKPLKDVVHLLLPLKDAGIDFYFHAGVTNWLGIGADEDILDALLLGTNRIGEGFAISKHPKLMHVAKERDVPVELTPLYDRVFGLYENIGNHPGAVLGALGVNFVINNGFPGMYGSKGVTYDWYLAFMGFASVKDDLRYLKKVALNSIEYSALSPKEKHDLFEIWREEWNIFIEKLAHGHLLE